MSAASLSPMEFIETPLPGAWLVGLEPFEDDRGVFARAFSEEEFARQGRESHVSQANLSVNSREGTVRGLHLQRPPHEEVKMVRCVQGAVFDVIVDVREGSSTRRQWFGRELSAENGLLMNVPKGFAHGFQSMTDGAVVLYLTSEPYARESESGLRWDDPVIGIVWPLPVTAISEKDRSLPLVDGL